MNYDFSISDNVSLSKILDAFLINDEDPNIVIEFLKQHEECIIEICNNSICISKLFQYNFFKQLNTSAKKYFDDVILQIPSMIYHSIYLCWQILVIDKHAVHTNFYRLWINKQQAVMHIEHPYKHFSEHTLYGFDQYCIQNLKVDIDPSEFIPAFLNKFDSNTYISFDKSLFFGLFLQYEVFSQLSDCWKYLVLSKLLPNALFIDKSTYNMDCALRFTEQCIEFETDDEILSVIASMLSVLKRYPYSKVQTYIENICRDFIDQFKNSQSIDELLLNCMLSGICFSQHTIIYMYIMEKYQWLKQWKDLNQSELDNILPITKIISNDVKYKKVS